MKNAADFSACLSEKESEADYGYIIDPDLVPFEIKSKLVEKLKASLPELADAKFQKFRDEEYQRINFKRI